MPPRGGLSSVMADDYLSTAANGSHAPLVTRAAGSLTRTTGDDSETRFASNVRHSTAVGGHEIAPSGPVQDRRESRLEGGSR
jgi:hypothetical protein